MKRNWQIEYEIIRWYFIMTITTTRTITKRFGWRYVCGGNRGLFPILTKLCLIKLNSNKIAITLMDNIYNSKLYANAYVSFTVYCIQQPSCYFSSICEQAVELGSGECNWIWCKMFQHFFFSYAFLLHHFLLIMCNTPFWIFA